MDPLSVSASVFSAQELRFRGLCLRWQLTVKVAQVFAQSLLQEMANILAALTYVSADVRLGDSADASGARRSHSILFDHLLTARMGCVTTYSDL